MRPVMRLTMRAVVGLLVAVLAAGCAGADGADGDGAAAGDPSGELVVFAAASLTEAFGRIGRGFEAAHPGVDVTFSFGGSSSLGPQVVSGAPADVFAAASRDTMARVVAAGATQGRPQLFARNRLQVAVPPSNPAGVGGLADFAREDLTLAVCAPQVPCGAAARRAFDAAGVAARPDTLEQDVKAVLTKVELGEVDAGLVYRTDVRAAAPRVRGVALVRGEAAVNDYQIAQVADAPNPGAAAAFVRFVLSPRGREALADAAFELP